MRCELRKPRFGPRDDYDELKHHIIERFMALFERFRSLGVA